MLTRHAMSLQSQLILTKQLSQLPPFSLPQGLHEGTKIATVQDGLDRVKDSQAGFVGKKIAVLVLNTLD